MFGPGEVLDGRYELRAPIGSGGMSTVYLAHDRRLGRDVAVKLLNAALAADAAFVERFRREAQNAAGLSHPNIVAVYDWGHDDGTYYIVMEYIEGSTLRDVMVRRGARPEHEALEIAIAIASALGAAHARGVIHRDVKPHNVLLDTEGGVKVTDFGISRATGESQLTDTGTVLGSAQYASPEQIERRPVDARSDVYGLGAVLYELLTGRPPFAGDGPLAIAWQHVHDQPAAPSTFAPTLSSAAEQAVLKALEKAPENRFQSASEMETALRAVLEGRALASATTAPLPAAPVTPAAPTALPREHPIKARVPSGVPTVSLPAQRPQRSVLPARSLILAALALLLLAPGGVFLSRARRRASLESSAIAAPTRDSVTTPTGQGVAGSVATAESRPTENQVTATMTLPPAATVAAGPPATTVPAPRPTSVPVSAAPPAVPPAPPSTQEPAAAISTFYAAIAQKQLAAAAAQWSPRMRAQYPPGEFIDQRFAQTQSLRVNGARLVETSGERAVVAIDLTEVIGNPPETRRWVGTWSLVNSGGVWLLDAPNLSPG